MRIQVNEFGELQLREVYNPIILVTNAGEVLSICMRDSGFELHYIDKSKSKPVERTIEIKEGGITHYMETFPGWDEKELPF